MKLECVKCKGLIFYVHVDKKGILLYIKCFKCDQKYRPKERRK